MSEFFWLSEESYAFQNTFVEQESDFPTSVLEENPGYLFFQTSGSSGKPKWVALSKSAMLKSAAAVNRHLNLTEADQWFCVLPLFHVGGMAQYTRAYLAGSQVTQYEGKWCVLRFLEQFEKSGANWVSLVPTQLVDIVKAKKSAPTDLRGTILGGGALATNIFEQAQKLGWRIHQSYGMTEACSQIATAVVPAGPMVLLPHIKWKLDERGCFQWQGESQFSGYVINGQFIPSSEWVVTQDKVRVNKGSRVTLEFLARIGREVKILGELVDIGSLEVEVNLGADQEVMLILEKEERRGYAIIPVVESPASATLATFLSTYTGVKKMEAPRLKVFTRSPLGKIIRDQ